MTLRYDVDETNRGLDELHEEMHQEDAETRLVVQALLNVVRLHDRALRELLGDPLNPSAAASRALAVLNGEA